MSTDKSNGRSVVVGSSPVSIEWALHDAALKALDEGVAGVGDYLVIERQLVRIDNPKIGEYRVEVTPGQP